MTKEQAISLVKPSDTVHVLKEVTVPAKYFNRIKLGVNAIDEMFGGQDMPGVLPGCSMLFTGTPGAGKSTLCLQLADLMQRAGRSVLYNVGEENENMVKLRADRLNLTMDFCVSAIEDVNQLVSYCLTNRVEVLFQDSLQSLRDGDLNGPAKLRSITKKLHCLSKDHDTTVVIVGHSTKGGTFAGPQEIKHDVDIHAHLALNSDSGNRLLLFEKNRFGPSNIPYEFAMSASGMDFTPTPAAQVLQKTAKETEKPNKRDAVKARIRELLLDGEKLSGYCFDRFDVECSGSFWRGMLALALKELAAEGHKVGEIRLASRLHQFLYDAQGKRE